jgi:hypothetical protein
MRKSLKKLSKVAKRQIDSGFAIETQEEKFHRRDRRESYQQGHKRMTAKSYRRFLRMLSVFAVFGLCGLCALCGNSFCPRIATANKRMWN